MRRVFLALFVLAGLILFAGCSGSGTKSAEEALEERGALSVLSDAAEDEYTPPDDGLLTDEQIEMYIQVREREVELGKVAAEDFKEREAETSDSGSSITSALEGLSALQDLGNVLTADIRAAQEMGQNTAEYQWVKSQVTLARLQVQSDEMMARIQEQLGSEEDAEEDDPEAEIHRQNAKILEKYKDRIEAVEAEVNEYRNLRKSE